MLSGHFLGRRAEALADVPRRPTRRALICVRIALLPGCSSSKGLAVEAGAFSSTSRPSYRPTSPSRLRGGGSSASLCRLVCAASTPRGSGTIQSVRSTRAGSRIACSANTGHSFGCIRPAPFSPEPIRLPSRGSRPSRFATKRYILWAESMRSYARRNINPRSELGRRPPRGESLKGGALRRRSSRTRRTMPWRWCRRNGRSRRRFA